VNLIRIGEAFTGLIGVLGILLILGASFLSLQIFTVSTLQPEPLIGIYYDYHSEQSTLDIVADLEQIHSDGFQIISIPFAWDSNPQSDTRVKTDVLYMKATQLGLKIYVRQPYSVEALYYYLIVYGSRVSYVQAVNEADVRFIKEWYVPAELTAIAQHNAETAKSINPNIKTVASFATTFLPNIIGDISSKVDIVALDIYEPVQLDSFPVQLQTLLTLSGKNNIWIGEFGYSGTDEVQRDFLIRGLNLFSKNKVEAVIIWVWENHVLAIKNRAAETAIKNWINARH